MSSEQNSKLVAAAKTGDLEAVKAALLSGADVDALVVRRWSRAYTRTAVTAKLFYVAGR